MSKLSIYAAGDFVLLNGDGIHGTGEYCWWNTDKSCYVVLSTGDVYCLSKNDSRQMKQKTVWGLYHQRITREVKDTIRIVNGEAGVTVEGPIEWVEFWGSLPVTDEMKAAKFSEKVSSSEDKVMKSYLYDKLMEFERSKIKVIQGIEGV